MDNTTLFHPAPHREGQTNQAWYVHVEGKSVTPLFDYQNRGVGETMFLALIQTATPFKADALDITGLGYEDITIIVQEKWLAQALVDCLNRLMPMASEYWRGNVDYDHVYAVQYEEVSESMDGEFYWVGGEMQTDENHLQPTN